MEEEGDTPFVLNDIASSDFKDNKCPKQKKIIFIFCSIFSFYNYNFINYNYYNFSIKE
jgi:hypothetical protein